MENGTQKRAIKRRIRPMLGFRKFRRARLLLVGTEVMHIIAEGRMENVGIDQSRRTVLLTLDTSTPNHIWT
ncbi:hypothetical protein CIC12_30960 [Burkholderia sp. SG-MS1]|nr:hypothetical protein [Paraburkholderia sp. SG-MS1]